MRDEVVALLDAIGAYNVAHNGDSDDAEVDAAFEMEDSALALVRRLSERDWECRTLLRNFEIKRAE